MLEAAAHEKPKVVGSIPAAPSICQRNMGEIMKPTQFPQLRCHIGIRTTTVNDSINTKVCLVRTHNNNYRRLNKERVKV